MTELRRIFTSGQAIEVARAQRVMTSAVRLNQMCPTLGRDIAARVPRNSR
jgi:hypothetical protein